MQVFSGELSEELMDKLSLEELSRDDWLEIALEGQLAQKRGLLQSSAATAGASSSSTSSSSGGVSATVFRL